MRGLMRLLIMFGPMIFRSIQKMQRSKQRQSRTQYPDRQIEQRGGRRAQQPRRAKHDRGEQVVYKDLNKELGRDKKTAEERDFELTEEDIMLDKEDLRHYEKESEQVDVKPGTEGGSITKVIEEGEAEAEPVDKLKKPDLELPEEEMELDLKELFKPK